ncbi:hypothetical protein H2200_003483 [Cladophialophora chaetospira]|uniref:Uncharacterized protein n=1 Tax=Cladophialophora chaetospira TaxID=386627 RepID=A0AA38XHM8_9EURO|nr:hypothetical protein H2200_003483 [Cladophialophora chaetospira]
MASQTIDELWQASVCHFLSSFPPAAVIGDTQVLLGNLVRGFLTTSRGPIMQNWVAVLDVRYNLVARELIDVATMHAINTNVDNALVPPPQQPPPAPMQPLQWAATPATTPNTTAMPTGPPPPPTLPPPPLPPPRSEPLGLKVRQDVWDYVCDVCGHKTGCRSDFYRHMRVGARRPGFKITKVDPTDDPHWYGTDDTSTPREGDMVPCTREKGEKKRIPAPCGSRIIAAEGTRRKEYRDARRAELARQEAELHDGEENESENDADNGPEDDSEDENDADE